MKTIEIGNYKLITKYGVPTIIFSERDEYGDEDITEFTFDDFDEALSNLFFFVWEDKLFHNTIEFKQSTAKGSPNKYREILENRFPKIGFAKLNANVITGLK